MSDWNAILTNAKNSGTFSGTADKEQDAYFAFFANDRTFFARTERTFRAVRKGMAAFARRAQAGGRRVAGFVLWLSAIANRKTPLTHDR